MLKRVFLAVIVCSFLLAGCVGGYSALQQATPIPFSDLLLTTVPTATPFQPIPPTPTATLMAVPSTTPLPTGTALPQFSTPDTNSLVMATGQINILILGSDARSDGGFRTDVIMLLSLNATKGTATLTSFPRDLYVNIPGVGMQRINTAQEYGGFSLTQSTFFYNFGFTPNYYMMTNFNGFKSIVDTLGGIDVNVASTLKDECSVRSLVDGMGYCTIPAGVYHMDGETALWYVRSRHSSSDFDRTRRAQEVITALFQTIASADGLNHAADLYSEFNSSVETNIPLTEILSLLPLANQIASNPALVRRYAIGAAQTYDYIVPGSGAMVLVPDQTAVMSIIQQALN
jgi:LCP family protein required for cell wall assembly